MPKFNETFRFNRQNEDATSESIEVTAFSGFISAWHYKQSPNETNEETGREITFGEYFTFYTDRPVELLAELKPIAEALLKAGTLEEV